ncbi:MAG: ABC transporter ATP-binding protein/permease [Oscillospiraceae bacterium]|nr:ABC transporter ATP-binding protein/permease [Oscillospiraceae bacterium]
MFKLVINTIKNSWKAHPPVFAALIFSSLFLCAIQVFEIYAMRFFFDAVADYANGAKSFGDVTKAALPIAVILVLGPVIDIGEYLAQGYFWRRGVNYLQSLFHLRAGKMDMADFEVASTFDNMKKAELGSDEAPSAGRSLIQLTFYYLPFFCFTLVFLIMVNPMLILAMAAIFVSVLVSQLMRAKTVFKFENENAGLKRQTEYFEACITAREYCKETRTLGVFGYFFKGFLESAKLRNKKSMHTEKKIALVEALLRLFNILGYAGIIGLLLYYIFDGSISVGAFAAVFYSVEKINNMLGGLVNEVGDIMKYLATTSFLFDFLAIPAKRKKEGMSKPLEKAVDIDLKDVFFAYPGTEKHVLKNINLKIKRGETLAIVGQNGAGKTTLTKLICGLYQPTDGEVFYGKNDICQYAHSLRYESISGVFQNFVKYKLTARENIQISDMDSNMPIDDVWNRAQVPQFSYGSETILSREFDGTEPSGGEWQRLAIARGFYRKHDLIVLDEPTAAIDPLEESSIFRLFAEAARDKTAILVTHRLGSAKIADRIIVLENGEIIESGTHDELMDQRGKYFFMFSQQAKWYVRA